MSPPLIGTRAGTIYKDCEVLINFTLCLLNVNENQNGGIRIKILFIY